MIAKQKTVAENSKVEERRRKRVLDTFGMFSNLKTSSASFAKRKESEIKMTDVDNFSII
jgi:hypothetical protein